MILNLVRFYRHYLPSDNQDDIRRREFVLNTLLCGITMAGFFSLVVSLMLMHFGENPYRGNTLPDLSFITLISLMLWRLSRAGHSLMSAYIFLASIATIAFLLAITWSFELPSVALICALLIMVASRVLNTRAALAITAIQIVTLPLIGNAQAEGLLHPRTGWLNEPLQRSDCIDYALLLGLIGLVSWLANLEIDRSLRCARKSESELREERDNLEKKVAARTSQLEQAQLIRMLELQRFAEFGRLNAHFLHEIANPLTAASLHLELSDHQQSDALKRARKDIQQLERYVNATRKQLKAESRRIEFRVRDEVSLAQTVLMPLAERAKINLNIQLPPASTKLFGDPVKFSQVIANLVVNAIDAYKDVTCPARERCVSVSFKHYGKYLSLEVHDRAKGISPDQLSKLFQPFYTTKQDTARGLGIGLSLVKQVVEQEFTGNIRVSSSPKQGTLFTAKLLMSKQKRPVPKSSARATANSAGLVVLQPAV